LPDLPSLHVPAASPGAAAKAIRTQSKSPPVPASDHLFCKSGRLFPYRIFPDAPFIFSVQWNNRPQSAPAAHCIQRKKELAT